MAIGSRPRPTHHGYTYNTRLQPRSPITYGCSLHYLRLQVEAFEEAFRRMDADGTNSVSLHLSLTLSQTQTPEPKPDPNPNPNPNETQTQTLTLTPTPTPTQVSLQEFETFFAAGAKASSRRKKAAARKKIGPEAPAGAMGAKRGSRRRLGAFEP